MTQSFQGEPQFEELTNPVSAGESTIKTDTSVTVDAKTDCQLDPTSEACKTDIMNLAEMLVLTTIPVVLLVLVFFRCRRQNSPLLNLGAGLIILVATFVFTVTITTHDLSNYLSEYPYVLVVMLFGASFGINLVSPFFTDKIVALPKVAEESEEETKLLPITENRSFTEEIEKLCSSLEDANIASKKLIAIYEETESERLRYKKSLESVKSIAEKALSDNNNKD
ncbi:hypothetical protein M2G69_20615 [Vibrio vulnificus]|nr:hypothetical protein [Vibrio vulnificus]HAU8253820.1 hypothetical protein [Vibrio vulnificus]